MSKYIANRISATHNSLFPDELEIDLINVTYHKGAVIGDNIIVIPRSNITSVYGRFNVFFADVIIESAGGRRVVAEGFKKSDVRDIVRILTK